MKKAKPKTARRKRPSKEAINSAKAVLEHMSKSGNQVHVMVMIKPMMLRFESRLEERDLGYAVIRPDLEIVVMPELCAWILFTSDGDGVALGSEDDVVVTIDLEERSAEELLESYPSINKFIH
jgi:hypothetical protein